MLRPHLAGCAAQGYARVLTLLSFDPRRGVALAGLRGNSRTAARSGGGGVGGGEGEGGEGEGEGEGGL